MVVVDEHRVQHEQLPNCVNDIDGFDDKIGGYEIVTIQPTADDAAHLGQPTHASYRNFIFHFEQNLNGQTYFCPLHKMTLTRAFSDNEL